MSNAPAYALRRAGREWAFNDRATLILAIQEGEVDGADLVGRLDDDELIPLCDHPEFRDELVDFEVMEEREPDIVDVDLTPMIDVTFLLLIFFMTTALVVMYKTLGAPQGQDDGAGAGTRRLPTRSEVEAQFLFVHVHADGTVSIGKGGLKVVGVERIQKALTEKIKADGKASIVIEADEGVTHGTVVEVIDAANLVQVEKILFANKVSGSKR